MFHRKLFAWGGGIAALATLLLAAPASANPLHSAGSCSASGQFADCSFARGSVYRPGTFHLKVTSSPTAQQVDVFWDISCDKNGYATFGDRSGSFTATTPVSRILPHPLTHPAHCATFVDVSFHAFDATGSLHAALTYTRWDGR